MKSRLRAIILGALTLLVMGSFAASAAYGEAGPFWHHRNNSKEEGGFKVEEKSPETVEGGGPAQTLVGSITLGKETKEPVELSAKQIQIKGLIWNGALQGQAKLEALYQEPTLVKPALKGCTVTIGQQNRVFFQWQWVWTWDGSAGQLTVKPQFPTQHIDGFIVFREILVGAEEVPKLEFTKVSLTGSGCGVLAGSYPVKGNVGVEAEPSNIEEWRTSLKLKIPKGVAKQHIWNGTKYIGFETGLEFAGNPAEYKGEAEVTNHAQENSVFEK